MRPEPASKQVRGACFIYIPWRLVSFVACVRFVHRIRPSLRRGRCLHRPKGTVEFALVCRKIGFICWVEWASTPTIFPEDFQKNRRGGRPCPPAENPVFSEIFGEFATSSGRTEASAPTNRPETCEIPEGTAYYISSAVRSSTVSRRTASVGLPPESMTTGGRGMRL